MQKKGIAWGMVVLWLIALIALMLILPTTAWGAKVWNSIKDAISFGEKNDDVTKFKNLPPAMDKFNIAMRDPERISPRDVERAELEKIIDSMTMVQEMTIGKSKVYLLESKLGDKKVFTLFSRDLYNGQLMILEKNLDLDDDYTYTYGEAFYTDEPTDEGMGIDETPSPLEWNADWNPTRNFWNIDKEISTTMDQYCEIGFCMPDALNQKLAELKI